MLLESGSKARKSLVLHLMVSSFLVHALSVL